MAPPTPWGRYPLLGADHTSQKSRPHLPEELIGKFRHRLSPGPETILATRTLNWGPTCVLPLFSQCSPTLFPIPNPVLINISHPPTQAEPPCWTKGHAIHQKSSLQLGWRLPTESEAILAIRNPGRKDQKTKKEIETMEQNIHPMKTNSEIGT